MLALVLVAGLLLAVVGTVAALRLRSPSGTWLDEVHRQEVIVTTTGGDSFRGLLASAEPEGLVLDVATLVAADEQLAGRVWLPRHTIRWVQKP